MSRLAKATLKQFCGRAQAQFPRRSKVALITNQSREIPEKMLHCLILWVAAAYSLTRKKQCISCNVKTLWVKSNDKRNRKLYNMATIVRALWLAAERALFSCNDRALWIFFLQWLKGSFEEVWVKATSAWAKTTNAMDKVNYKSFNNWKKN